MTYFEDDGQTDRQPSYIYFAPLNTPNSREQNEAAQARYDATL